MLAAEDHSVRLTLLCLSIAGFIAANPITFTLTGNITGNISDGESFTDAPFTLTYGSDTSTLLPAGSGPAMPNAIFANNVIADLSIVGVTATLTDLRPACAVCFFTNAFYLDPSNGTAGLAYFFSTGPSGQMGPVPYVTIADPAFNTWDMTTSLGPLSVQSTVPFNGLDVTIDTADGHHFAEGGISFSSFTITGFDASVAGVPSTVPEPGTALLLCLGIAGIAVGKLRRR